MSNKEIEAFRRAEQEMQDEWEVRQAAAVAKTPSGYLRNEVLAAHWLIVFAPHYCAAVQEGLPIGNVLDILKQQSRELPPVVEAVWQEWHEKIKAARPELIRTGVIRTHTARRGRGKEAPHSST
jgi:hypothetical protein